MAIIDKTGSVIIHRQTGKVDAAEWEKMLNEHKDGVRRDRQAGFACQLQAADGVERTRARLTAQKPYCPSCQAKAVLIR